MLNFRVPTFTIPCNVVNAERVRPKGPRAKIQFLHAILRYQKKSSFHRNKMQTNMHTLSLQYHSAEDEKMPMMCYHLRSCVPKLVKRFHNNLSRSRPLFCHSPISFSLCKIFSRSECPLEKNNYIDHR